MVKLRNSVLLIALAFVLVLVSSAPVLACQGAALDNNVRWNGVQHNSFEGKFRDVFGAVKTNQGQVRLRLRTCGGDVETVRVRLWDDRIDTEYWLEMEKAFSLDEDGLGPTDYWQAAVQIPTYPTIIHYFFELRDGSDVDYYTDKDLKKFSGGEGKMSENWRDDRSFSITVYDKDFKVPDWFKGALVYQIFPDRFRNGDTSNDPQGGKHWENGRRARFLNWQDPICDPRTAACFNEYGNQFYGGDLDGIVEKLDYLKDLGVEVLYLNPIFMSPSNHKYDTQDYMRIDPTLGGMPSFERLVEGAKEKGMKIVLDGVFNHTSADSPYFDYFSRWNAAGDLTSVDGPGLDDGSGACESPYSRYREWYYLPARHEPALNEARTKPLECPRSPVNEPGERLSTYEAWFGYYTLPKLRTDSLPVRKLFYLDDDKSVGPYWMYKGAAGWRLDVGGNVDPGYTVDPNNHFWEEFRTAVKKADPEAVIIGEEWGDATPWLLGHEWDSTMNYRLRSALLDWMFDGCQGLGCYGRKFEDNDSNDGTHSGPIEPLSESQLWHRLQSIRENYPPEAWRGALNLLGSHDTNRIFFLLKKISRESGEEATLKHKMLATFIYTYPGAPTIYYGDEAGVEAEGKWDGSTWQDDPYNRVVFPWRDMGFKSDMKMYDHYRSLSDLRGVSDVLRNGDYETVLVDDKKRLFSFARSNGKEHIVVLFNRKAASQDVRLSLGKYAKSGQKVSEIFSQKDYPLPQGGSLVVNMPRYSSKVFVIR